MVAIGQGITPLVLSQKGHNISTGSVQTPGPVRFWREVEGGCEDGPGLESSRQDGAGEVQARGPAFPACLGFSLLAISLCSPELWQKRGT